MTIAIADTSFLVATLNRRDAKRNACLQVYQQHWEKIYILEAALAEVAYMIRRESDIPTMVGFFKALPATKYSILALEMVDIYRAMTVIEQYPALKLDFVDACITAVAERLKISTILTLDQRDFRVIRPRHVDYWKLLPEA